MLNKQLVESACKKVLLTAVMESESLRKKLTLEEHTALCEKVLELKYNEVLPLAFGDDPTGLTEQEMRDYESKFKKNLKYGLAATAGSYGTRKAVGKATGQKLTGVMGRLAHPIKKTKWGVVGAGIGMAAYYLYRQLSDPCRAKAALASGTSQDKAVIKHQCQAEASKKVISQLNSSLQRCDDAKNPVKCKAKIQKEVVIWKKRLQNELITLAKLKRKV